MRGLDTCSHGWPYGILAVFVRWAANSCRTSHIKLYVPALLRALQAVRRRWTAPILNVPRYLSYSTDRLTFTHGRVTVCLSKWKTLAHESPFPRERDPRNNARIGSDPISRCLQWLRGAAGTGSATSAHPIWIGGCLLTVRTFARPLELFQNRYGTLCVGR
jgi:hypothetical protein